MRWFCALLVFGLLVLHQDWWQWHRDDLLFGFLPWSLAWHMSLSVVTTIVWFLVVRYCWPADAHSDRNGVRSTELAE